MTNAKKKEIHKAAIILKKGGVVAFPTETVYGLGARFSSKAGIRRIFSIKSRPQDNPLIAHISDLKQLKLLARNIPDIAYLLAQKFWPGPLTFVLKKSARVSREVTAGLSTVAVRMPRHPVALELIRQAGEPIAAPSANLSGRPSPTHFRDVVEELGGKADYILPGGRAKVGLESTVLDLTCKPARVLRPGAITIEDLKRVLESVEMESPGKGPARSPGMKHRHYQPRCEVVLVDSGKWDVTLAAWSKKKLRLGVIAYNKHIPSYRNIVFKNVHRNKNEYARNLYSDFFKAEKSKVKTLLAETVDPSGLGLAIMDRLRRAAHSPIYAGH